MPDVDRLASQVDRLDARLSAELRRLERAVDRLLTVLEDRPLDGTMPRLVVIDAPTAIARSVQDAG